MFMLLFHSKFQSKEEKQFPVKYWSLGRRNKLPRLQPCICIWT